MKLRIVDLAQREAHGGLPPLPILDAYSRYLLRCEGLLDPDGKEAS